MRIRVRTTRATTTSGAVASLCVAILLLAACGSGRTDNGASGANGAKPLVVGTTDKVTSLDPAGAYDNGSFALMNQSYQFLMNFAPGSSDLKPDAAQSCEFSKPTVYTCTIKSGLKFADGHPLTAKSAAFSLNRVLKINDPNGPASLLGNLDNAAAASDTVVNFTLKQPNDQTFPQILATNAGPIVDEQVFPADKVMDDNAIVDAKAFSGPYTITSYTKNQLVNFKADPDYNGALGKPKTADVSLRYYASSDNLKLDVQQNSIDVAYRSLTPTDVDSLEKSNNVTVHHGPGGELRYIVFNLNTMPGNTPEQKLAVRKAMASSVDRDALANSVYKGTYSPAYSAVPSTVKGSTPAFKDTYGAKPDKAEATKFLTDAGVTTPVTVDIQYAPDHYGSTSGEEYAAIKSQLESTGLFKVNLQSTEYTTYSKQRVKDAYPVYQLGWFPDFPDADNYLTPFFGKDNFLQSHFDNPGVQAQLSAEATEPDAAKRTALIKQIQTEIATQYLPILPLLEGTQVVVAGKNVNGVDETLDASFKFRFGTLTKS